jgi:hypothetical protein
MAGSQQSTPQVNDNLGEVAVGIGLSVATGGQAALAETALHEVNRELDNSSKEQATGESPAAENSPAGQDSAAEVETGGGEVAETADLDGEMVDETFAYAAGIFRDLNLNISDSELRPMLKQAIREAGQHGELSKSESKKEEILGYMAAGVWRELMTRLGLAKVVDTNVDGKEILKRIREGVWAETIPATEITLLNQASRTDGVGARLTKLVVATCTVGGQPVELHSPEMQKILDAVGQKTASDGDLTDEIGDRLRFLAGIDKELRELKQDNDQQIGDRAATEAEQQQEAMVVEELKGVGSSAAQAETGQVDVNAGAGS